MNTTSAANSLVTHRNRIGEVLSFLRPCTQHLTQSIYRLGQSIEDIRQSASTTSDVYSEKMASTLLHLMSHIQRIDYDEFRNLVGLLQMIHQSPESMNLAVVSDHRMHNASSAFKDALQELQTLYDLQTEILGLIQTPKGGLHPFRGDPDLLAIRQKLQSVRQEFEMTFAEDALIMLRTVYPYGINILNPDWNPSYPFSIPCDRMFALTISASIPRSSETTPRLIFRPNHQSPTMTDITFESLGSHGIKTSFPISLIEGQSLLIGRHLSIPNLFGISRGKVLTELPAQGNISNSLWSRGGLLAIRTGDEIFLLDRGSRNPLAVWSEDILPGFSMIYHPQIITGSLEKVSFGANKARFQ